MGESGIQLPILMQNSINLGLRAIQFQARQSTDVLARVEMLQFLKEIAEFQSDWCRFVAARLEPGVNDESILELKGKADRIDAAKNELLEAQQPDESLDPNEEDAEDFYESFMGFLAAIVVICCESFDYGLMSFVDAVLRASNIVEKDLETIKVKPKEKMSVLEIQQIATIHFAKLAEAASMLGIQPTTNPELGGILNDFSESMGRELNENFADAVNVILNSKDLVDDGPEWQNYFSIGSDMQLLINNFQDVIQDEIQRLKSHHYFSIFTDAMKEAKDFHALCLEVFQGELNVLEETGANKELERYLAKSGQEASKEEKDLAAKSDTLEADLEKLYFALTAEEKLPDVLEVIEEATPTLQSIPKSLTPIVTKHRTEVSDVMKNAREVFSAAFDGFDEIITSLQNFDNMKDTQIAKYMNRARVAPNLLIDIFNAISLEVSATLFCDDDSEDLRQFIMSTISEVDSIELAVQVSPNDMKTHVPRLLMALKTAREQFENYQPKLAANAAEKLSTLRGVEETLKASVKGITDSLRNAANDMIDNGYEAEKLNMFRACSSVSGLLDLSGTMLPRVWEEELPDKEEPALPSSQYYDQSEFLDTIRALYDMAPLPADPNPPAARKRRQLTGGFVKRRVIVIEDGPDEDETTPKAEKKVGKLSESLMKLFLEAEAAAQEYKRKEAERIRKKRIAQGLAVQIEEETPKPTILIRKSKKPHRGTRIPKHAKQVDVIANSDPDSIWRETGKVTSTLSQEGDLIVKGGSLNQILIHLSSEASAAFTSTFFHTFQVFITPKMLFQKLIERFEVPPCPKGGDEKSYQLGVRGPVQTSVSDIFKKWLLKRFDQDFVLDSDLIELCKQFFEGPLKQTSDLLGRNLTRSLNAMLEGPKYKFHLNLMNYRNVNDYVDFSLSEPLSDIFQQLDVRDVARQLTLVTAEMFRSIRLAELVEETWKRPDADAVAPHVLCLLNFSNQLAIWVAQSILNESRIRGRRKVFGKMVQLAHQFIVFGNYHAAFSCIAGLQTMAVHRLKYTKKDLSKKNLELLEETIRLVSPDEEFKNYRETLKERRGPLVPFLGVILNDLVDIEIENVKTNPLSTFISWEKCDILDNRVINDFLQYQTRSCDFAITSNKKLQASVVKSILDAQCAPSDLILRSVEVEPPNQVPPERYGFLKVEKVIKRFLVLPQDKPAATA